jgi:L-arabinose isomerase
MENQKAKVGMLGLMLELYDMWPELKVQEAAFANELVGALSPFAEVEFPGVCNTKEQVDTAVRAFEAAGKDIILVVLLTYAPSHIALQALLHTPLPILIFNTQKLIGIDLNTLSDETTQNHGMHGVQDLTNVLLRARRAFHLVTGHYQDKGALTELEAWCQAARAVKMLRRMRIGQIGYAMEGMGDFGLDETAFLSQLGVQVHHIAMKALATKAQEAPQALIKDLMDEDRSRFEIASDITPDEHAASLRLEWALRETLQTGKMQGFTYHFLAVGEEGWLETVPFLAAAKLLGEGYGFGGEGDVTSAAAVSLMNVLAGEANFTEMFTMDFAHDAVLMMHMGEGNWKLARMDEPVRMLRSTLKLVPTKFDPLLLAFSLKPGDVTLTSLTTTAMGKLKFVVTEGQVLDFPYIKDMARPSYKFSPNGKLEDFLTRYSLAGGSHHQALAYGCWARTMEKVAALLGIECAIV